MPLSFRHREPSQQSARLRLFRNEREVRRWPLLEKYPGWFREVPDEHVGISRLTSYRVLCGRHGACQEFLGLVFPWFNYCQVPECGESWIIDWAWLPPEDFGGRGPDGRYHRSRRIREGVTFGSNPLPDAVRVVRLTRIRGGRLLGDYRHYHVPLLFAHVGGAFMVECPFDGSTNAVVPPPTAPPAILPWDRLICGH